MVTALNHWCVVLARADEKHIALAWLLGLHVLQLHGNLKLARATFQLPRAIGQISWLYSLVLTFPAEPVRSSSDHRGHADNQLYVYVQA